MTQTDKNILSKKERFTEIINILSSLYPDVKIQLDYSTPFELLIATILSAQCTDARVNIVTKELFMKYKQPKDYLNIKLEELEKDIYSTGFYKSKSKNIRGACEQIIDRFNNEIPNTLEELTTLPGVGRKTANVVLGHCFGVPSIVVDTHVIRLSNRMGLVSSKDPEKIEFELMEIIDKNQWVVFTHYFINHGRKICTGQSPKCLLCAVSRLCPSSEIFISKPMKQTKTKLSKKKEKTR